MGSGMNYCAELGDSKRLLRKMDSIYNNLKTEIAA